MSIVKIFVPFISMGLFLPVFAFAQTPSLPHQFFGTVNFTNGVAPNGLSVEARIRITGAVVGSSVTANGKYGYNPNLLFATDNQGVNAGKTVEFYVGGIKANEIAIFTNGNSSQINLTIPEAIPTIPAPSPVPASTGGGGGGGTPPATYKTGDTDKNGKVDIFDFNLLMINWGDSPTNLAADLDGNGKVDIFDFNLLMINWG